MQGAVHRGDELRTNLMQRERTASAEGDDFIGIHQESLGLPSGIDPAREFGSCVILGHGQCKGHCRTQGSVQPVRRQRGRFHAHGRSFRESDQPDRLRLTRSAESVAAGARARPYLHAVKPITGRPPAATGGISRPSPPIARPTALSLGIPSPERPRVLRCRGRR